MRTPLTECIPSLATVPAPRLDIHTTPTEPNKQQQHIFPSFVQTTTWPPHCLLPGRASQRQPRAISTRELATQIANEALRLTSHHDGFEVELLVGGESRRGQLRSWKGRKDLVVATPGRLRDLIGEREVETVEAYSNGGFFIV